MRGASPACEVAIVGYGPTGATLANLLGMLGVRVVVLERERGLVVQPRAVHFDGEIMRVFQTAGLAEALLPRVRPSAGMRYVSPSGVVMVERKPALGEGAHGWANNYLFHQPDLENALRAGVARFASVEVREGWEVQSIEPAGDSVSLKGPDGEVRAQWVVGCDGARSLVRQAIGSEHHDLGLHQPWLVFDVVLERPVDLPLPTVQYCDPARPVTLVNVTGMRRRWEIMLMPGDVPERMTEPETVWRLVAPWIKPGDARIERAAVYTFHSLIAKRWRSGRLLIAGDAAHQTPPFLGQGMCAGIRDAANLAWKLEQVVRNRASEALIDTYQSEREPHARNFIQEAVRLGAILQTTDPAVAAERDRRFRETGKEEMVNLTPALGPGAHDAMPPAGEIHPQPRLADGRRLDEAIGGYRFALLGPRELLAQAAVRVHAVPIEGEQAILLRPDRYIAGVARTAPEIRELVEKYAGRGATLQRA
jgi:3-(3-hydroxy-phenyl)propionate hydroxylase